MPVQNPLCHYDQSTFPDAFAGKIVGADRLPAHAGGGGIETHGFLDHGLRRDEARGIVLDGPGQNRVRFIRENCLPPLREREKKKRPGQGIGGGLMPRRDKGQDIGFDFGVAKPGAGLRILGFEREGEYVSRRAGFFSAKEAFAPGDER